MDCLCLKCPFPAVSSGESGKRRRRQTAVRMVSLDMDGVSSVKNLSRVQVYPDPVYDKFKGGERVYKGEALSLNVSSPFPSSISFDANSLFSTDMHSLNSVRVQILTWHVLRMTSLSVLGESSVLLNFSVQGSSCVPLQRSNLKQSRTVFRKSR